MPRHRAWAGECRMVESTVQKACSPTHVVLQAFKASSLLIPLKSFDVYTTSISDKEAKKV